MLRRPRRPNNKVCSCYDKILALKDPDMELKKKDNHEIS